MSANQSTENKEAGKKSTALVSVSDFDQKYPEGEFNQLMPSKTMVESVQLYSRLSVEIVQISTDPLAQEVYSLGKTRIQINGQDEWVEKFSPTKTALDKLWFAMGVESVPEKSGRTDNRADRDYFEYVVVGRVTKPDGSKIEVSATKVIDIRAYIEEMFENLTQTHDRGNLGEWRGPKGKKTFHKFSDTEAHKHIEQKCRAREIEMRKHGLQLAETGAKNRLVRSITNLKPWYTEEELQKPFVVARIDRNVEELASNPKTRAEMIRAGSHASDMAYPEPPVSIAKMPTPTDADFTDIEPEQGNEPAEQEREGKPSDDPEFVRNEFEAQCQEMDPATRFRTMEDLIKKRQIKAEGSDVLLSIEYGNWEKRDDADQVKNLMWAFDHPQPDGLPH